MRVLHAMMKITKLNMRYLLARTYKGRPTWKDMNI